MLKKTGFRIDSSQLKRKLKQAKDSLRVDIFKPALLDYFRKTLNECIKLTPIRDYGTIQINQSQQYANRVNYIPNIHDTDVDPRLVVNASGHWLFTGGKWYKADSWL